MIYSTKSEHNRVIKMIYKGKHILEEAPETGDKYRRAYAEGIDAYISRLNTEGKNNRRCFMPPESFKDKIEDYRAMYIKMLGIDRVDNADCPPPTKTFVASDDMCDIYRLTVYITKEIPFYAMLFVPHEITGKAPLVVMQHGGGGSPELCMDLIGDNNYTNTGLRILERGAVVLAPQIMVWSLPGVERGHQCDVVYDRGKSNNNLKRFGMSITGLEISGIMRCIDYASNLDIVDSEHIGMVGLSYGGYFTMHTMAADKRIKVGLNCAAFNDRDAYPWQDWTYPNSGNTFQDAEIAGLCAPRKLYISIGKADEVFDWHTGEKETERTKAYYNAMNCPDNLFVTVWDGGHRVKTDSEPIDFLFDNI